MPGRWAGCLHALALCIQPAPHLQACRPRSAHDGGCAKVAEMSVHAHARQSLSCATCVVRSPTLAFVVGTRPAGMACTNTCTCPPSCTSSAPHASGGLRHAVRNGSVRRSVHWRSAARTACSARPGTSGTGCSCSIVCRPEAMNCGHGTANTSSSC